MQPWLPDFLSHKIFIIASAREEPTDRHKPFFLIGRTTIMLDLFKEEHWVGEFFVVKAYEARFTGEISYSPENGVVLSYAITGRKMPKKAKLVHGFLRGGEKCTLVGKFSPENSKFIFNNGTHFRNGEANFLCLFIGDHLDETELLYDINFSLTNMQEFFFHKGRKNLIKHPDKPLFKIPTDYGEIEIINSSSFEFFHNICSLVYSQDRGALDELERAFEVINTKYPNANFMLKKDIKYKMRLKINNGTDIISAYKHINEIAELFSMLMYCPVHPESIYAIKNLEKGNSISISIYPSMMLNKRTIELCTRGGSYSHFAMPIRVTKIDLVSTIKEWLKKSKDYSTIISNIIQSETGYRNLHSLYGELILYATQFEKISHDDSKNDSKKNKKYEYPVDNYGTPKIKDGIKNILSIVGETDLGKGIASIRNEITHIGRPKKLLNILSINDIFKLVQYFQITIIGYVLHQLKIDKAVISEYQDKFIPDP